MHSARLLAYVSARQMTRALNQQSGPAGWLASNHDANVQDGVDNKFQAEKTSSKLTPSDTEIFNAVFVSLGPKPSREEVRAAVIRAVDANSERLFRTAAVDSYPRTAVADEFTVVGLNTHGRPAWPEVEANESVAMRE